MQKNRSQNLDSLASSLQERPIGEETLANGS